MSFTSTFFVLFITFTTIIYYLTKERFKWIILLSASLIFYATFSPKAFLYIIPTAIEVYFFALWIQKIQNLYDAKLSECTDKDQKKSLRSECSKKKKTILTFSLIITFGILCVLKYTNFVILNITSLINFNVERISFKPFNLFVPLGLSFYTFSAASYLFDVYNKKYSAEKKLHRFVLFITWFPSIIQGPINRYNQLSEEFFKKEHKFNLQNTQFALQRILWGFLKKLVIADRADQVVTYIFDTYDSQAWFVILFGLFIYSIELYADFAGGMDIALGVSELFGIKLPENFRQPYFATSVADFWRRWHITLGSWMRDYIFYPFALTKGMQKLCKWCNDKLGKSFAKSIPACISNILVFLIVGIWHGAEWHFVFWGLYQGGIIAISTLLEPVFDKINVAFHIKTESFGFRIFRTVRTFFIILLGYIVDYINDMHKVFGMTKQLFSFNNNSLISNFSYQGFGKLTIFVVLLFSAVWFIVSIYKEKGVDIRLKISQMALPVRWIIYLALILSIPFFQASDSIGFMYANF